MLDLSGDLQRATSLGAVVHAMQEAVARTTRYRTSWLVAFEDAADGRWGRVLGIEGTARELVWERVPRFPVTNDPVLLEIIAGERPVVVEDMATDPRTNKELVERTRQHTVVCVPMRLGRATIGVSCAGTFGDEGVVPPTAAEVENLTVMTSLVTSAFDRMRVIAERDAADARASALAETSQALEAQLRHAQRLEAVGLLAGGVAHDFNNLLTAIACHAELALAEDPSPTVRESLQIIRLATDRGSHLTHNLLSFSRRRVLTRRLHDLNEVARRAHALVRAAVRSEIELRFEPDSAPVHVVADDVELEHAIINLVTNARDAIAGPGEITIRVDTTPLDDAFVARHGGRLMGTAARVELVDTGSGMDAATLDRVFEPFFSTKSAGRGTGLGLATVRAIVEQHAGVITAVSTSGAGTTFSVYLPLASSTGGVVSQPVAPPPANLSAGSGETILLAEDDELVRALLARVLRGRGYRVIEAQDGQEAIDRFRAESASIDLVLTDLLMPRRSGLELIDAVLAFVQGTPIVVMSGYTSDPVGAARVGALGLPIIDKPTTPSEVLTAVRRALDRARLA